MLSFRKMPYCLITALGYSSCRLSSSSTKLAFFAVITQTATHYQPTHPPHTTLPVFTIRQTCFKTE